MSDCGFAVATHLKNDVLNKFSKIESNWYFN